MIYLHVWVCATQMAGRRAGHLATQKVAGHLNDIVSLSQAPAPDKLADPLHG